MQSRAKRVSFVGFVFICISQVSVGSNSHIVIIAVIELLLGMTISIKIDNSRDFNFIVFQKLVL